MSIPLMYIVFVDVEFKKECQSLTTFSPSIFCTHFDKLLTLVACKSRVAVNTAGETGLFALEPSPKLSLKQSFIGLGYENSTSM